ncbi:Acylphosphatase-like domain-containing protein [Diplogelasinospora grovesii]|uniref:acylphosphatase n=1 Tax=Diplogelasinospora grovesii TaxID=303347 RepID=A0AAN6S1J6_9PEZI|nr:Acylphosphatase-like domain-containing protein [Diplogelasinospora grovesii]
MVKRVYFLAHGGKVQGVGFRYFTQKRAVEYNLTGWVRNTDNNKVEGEAQGPEDSLAKFLKDIDKGPRHAHVVRLDKEDRDVVEGEESFEVRR